MQRDATMNKSNLFECWNISTVKLWCPECNYGSPPIPRFAKWAMTQASFRFWAGGENPNGLPLSSHSLSYVGDFSGERGFCLMKTKGGSKERENERRKGGESRKREREWSHRGANGGKRKRGTQALFKKNICGEMEITKFRYRSVHLILLGRSVRGGAFSPMRASAVRTNCLWDTRPPAR